MKMADPTASIQNLRNEPREMAGNGRGGGRRRRNWVCAVTVSEVEEDETLIRFSSYSNNECFEYYKGVVVDINNSFGFRDYSNNPTFLLIRN